MFRKMLLINLMFMFLSVPVIADNYAIIIQGTPPMSKTLSNPVGPIKYNRNEYLDEFWNDPLLFKLIFQSAGVPEGNIWVLWGDGSQYGYEDTTYQERYRVPYVDMSASRANFDSICDYLAGILTEDDILFVYGFSHGNRNEFCLYESVISDTAFARLLDQIPYEIRLVLMQQCMGGSFIDVLQNERTVMMTATDSLHEAWEAENILVPGDTMIWGSENEIWENRTYHHGEWNFHFLTGFWGGIMPSLYFPGPVFRDSIDVDNNGKISLAEIHNWILVRDSWYANGYEFPQLSDLGDLADRFYVWPAIEIAAVGIEKPNPVQSRQFVKVGPNPCYGIVKFIPQVNKRLTYSVFNASGRLVVKTDQSTIKINTAGVYFYQVAMDNKVVQTGKLVILK